MTFGIEIELNFRRGRRAGAQIIKDYFNNKGITTTMGHTNSYDTSYLDNYLGRWKCMNDGSVNNALEFVTPPLEYTPENIEIVQECVRELKSAGATAHSDCGVHVHIDGSLFKGVGSGKRLRNLVKLFYMKQDLFYKAIGVSESRYGHWCKKVTDQVFEAYKKAKNNKLDNYEYARHFWYDLHGEGNCRAPWNEHYMGSRYHGLNLHALYSKGTIEFRLFDGTTHAGKIKSYIQFAHQMVDYCAKADKIQGTTSVNFSENERFFMRTFLNQLGMIGAEYKTAHHHLEEPLSGDPSFRFNNRRDYTNTQVIANA